MGSIMDSRYWTCPSCFKVFDWNDSSNGPNSHDSNACKIRKESPPFDPQKELRLKLAKPTPKTLFVAMMTPCTYESAYKTLSVHETQEGAGEAIRKAKKAQKKLYGGKIPSSVDFKVEKMKVKP